MDSSLDESALGLCIGASTIKVAELTCVDGDLQLGRTQALIHNCDTRDCLRRVLSDYPLASYQYVCVTGRKHRNLVNLPSVTEPEAVELAMRFMLGRYPGDVSRIHALLSLGSENFIAYELNAAGAIAGVRTSNKCASGTGEFFLQQLRRMDIPLTAASELARAAEPYAVCGRCSVFCKSDCTHALNKGIPTDRVLAGLGNMIADKALEILGAIPRHNIMVVGGVTKNAYVMDQLRSTIEDLFVPAEADVFEAIGAAACAVRLKTRSTTRLSFATSRSSFGALPPLQDAQHLVVFREGVVGHARPGDVTVLGLDVGSTTTKAVLMRAADSQVLASVYLRTNGNPIRGFTTVLPGNPSPVGRAPRSRCRAWA